MYTSFCSPSVMGIPSTGVQFLGNFPQEPHVQFVVGLLKDFGYEVKTIKPQLFRTHDVGDAFVSTPEAWLAIGTEEFRGEGHWENYFSDFRGVVDTDLKIAVCPNKREGTIYVRAYKKAAEG